MKRGRHWLRVAVLVFMQATMPLARAQESGVGLDENTAKVAYLYNFMLLTKWPAALPDPVLLCVLAWSALDPQLRALNGRPLANQNTLAVVNVRPDEALNKCHAVYIDGVQGRHVRAVLARLHGLPVLTVTDGEGLADRGVMIEIIRRHQRLGFEVNLGPASRAQLQFNSRMLKLASHVSQAQNQPWQSP